MIRSSKTKWNIYRYVGGHFEIIIDKGLRTEATLLIDSEDVSKVVEKGIIRMSFYGIPQINGTKLNSLIYGEKPSNKRVGHLDKNFHDLRKSNLCLISFRDSKNQIEEFDFYGRSKRLEEQYN